jgi:pyruvate dehydrogenase E1 component
MYYREDKAGQILQEGINEAGGMSSWIAAATSYSTNNRVMIPFFTYYSMFGMQRVGDLAWAAGDMRARGFLMGGTAGRTTLNGEGLQHEDGHSHLFAAAIPNCLPYDPTFGHELAVIVHDGLRRMVTEQEDVFYYITIMNENYAHPGLKAGQEEGILKGMYLLQEGTANAGQRVQLIGSGTILRESIFAAELLEKDWGVAADVWSAPSLTLVARDGQDAERWNLVNPTKEQRVPYVTGLLKDTQGPIIATTDYMRLYAEQIRAFMPKDRTYRVLGTDGFGRSDSRAKLREFFEVNRYYITVAALRSLADEGKIDISVVEQAVVKYGLNPNKPNPVTQ